MQRCKRLAVAAAFTALAGAIPGSALAQTKVVYAGGPAKWATHLINTTGAGINNFLLNRVTIHVGDTVAWNGKSLANGFHSIDFPAKGGADLPLIIGTGSNETGVKDAAGNPFWFNGQPQLTFNPALFGASGGNTYDGSKRIESGLPFTSKDFKLTFTKAGTYKYFCDVHYGMVGYVVVRPKGKKIPSAAKDSAALKRDEKHYAKEAKRVDHTKVAANQVSVGASSKDGLEVFAMFPAKLTVSPGTTVNFVMSQHTRETHTATFGDVSKPNGYVYKLGQTAFTSPTGVIDGIGAYPSDVPAISLNAASHGNGFANTGALDRDGGTSTVPASNKITFTQKGTYTYICLIHPFMEGTVVVK